MKIMKNLVSQEVLAFGKNAVTNEELQKEGFKLFKHTITVESTLVQFIGKIATHEIYVIFRFKDSTQVLGLSTGRKTDDCIGDKDSFLRSAFAEAFGKYITSEFMISASLSGNKVSVKSMKDEFDRL